MSNSEPSYLRIYKEILQSIHSQEIPAGGMLPTENELCIKYNVSRPTVARAFKMLSDDKLVRRKPGFGTQVLQPRKSALLAGVLIPQFSETEIFGPICASIAETAGIEGMRVIRPTELNMADDLKKRTTSLADQLIAAKVRGVFFAPTEHVDNPSEFNMSIIERFKEAGIHVVLLDRDVHRWPRQTPYEMISIDNVQAGYVVADHLLNLGCKKLAYVTRENPATTVQLRRMGCREALIQRNKDPKSLISYNHIADDPAQAAKEFLADGADGIICANDATASQLLRGLRDLNISIPSKVKVAAFDNVKYASLLSVPLTSYQQPCHDLGKIAAEAMIHRIRFPDTPIRRIQLQGELIIRESTAGKSNSNS